MLRFRLSSDGAIDDTTIVRPQADRPPAWLKKEATRTTRLCRNALLCSGVMSSLRLHTKAKAKAKTPRSWAVTLIKNRGVFLGFVEAPDQKAADNSD
jgi:hypothetical protein